MDDGVYLKRALLAVAPEPDRRWTSGEEQAGVKQTILGKICFAYGGKMQKAHQFLFDVKHAEVRLRLKESSFVVEVKHVVDSLVDGGSGESGQ